jgi:hypothetical protein
MSSLGRSLLPRITAQVVAPPKFAPRQETSFCNEPKVGPSLLPILLGYPFLIGRHLAGKRRCRPDDQPNKISNPMWCENFHTATFDTGRDGRRRLWPTPDCIEDIPVGLVAVANMHARLVVNGPSNMGMLCEQAGFDRQVSVLTCIGRIAVHNVNVTARDPISGKAVMIVPNGIVYETGANPAVLDAKFPHCGQQRHYMRLSLKELGNVVASLHAGHGEYSTA